MLGGFIAAAVAALVALVIFLTNLNIFPDMIAQGFGPWLNNCVTHITAQKVLFVIAVVVLIVGVVFYCKGRSKAKKNDEAAPFVPAGITKYCRDIKGEFKKIVWPTFPTVVRNTGVTLAMCAVTAAIIIIVDTILGQLVGLLLGL